MNVKLIHRDMTQDIVRDVQSITVRPHHKTYYDVVQLTDSFGAEREYENVHTIEVFV